MGGLRRLAMLVSGMVTVAGASNLWLDSRADSSGDGSSPETPAVSLSAARSGMGGGDTLFLARGASWTNDSLVVWWSGEAGHPWVMTAWGDSAQPAPLLSNPGATLLATWRASHLVFQGLHLSGGADAGLRLDDSASDVAVRDLEIEGCGFGIAAGGSDIAIEGVRVHDLKMIVNTEGATGTHEADDDYGAVGVVLDATRGVRVVGNVFERCRAPSADYGYDGGAVEIWKGVRDAEISGNLALETDGFIEMGGETGDTASGIRIHHNLALETGNFSWIHGPSEGSYYSMEYRDVALDHNTFVTRGRSAVWLVGTGGDFGDPANLKVRDNLFVADTLADGFIGEDAFEHEANLFATPWDPREDAESASPADLWGPVVFTDTSAGDWSLAEGSAGREAGLDLGYAVDFRGVALPETPDIGAFQSVDPAILRESRGSGTIPSIRLSSAAVVLVDPPWGDEAVRVAWLDASGRVRSRSSLPGGTGSPSLPPPQGGGFLMLAWRTASRSGFLPVAVPR